MSDSALQSRIAGAEAYEQLMVPALFAPWSPAVCDAARVARGHAVLDLACGTGVLAREALRRVGEAGRIRGLDPNPGMLEVARRLAPQVEWRQGAAESLPYPDDTFDAVISQFGMMFFGDRRASLREVSRVLKPGGRFAIAVWDSLARNPAYHAEVSVVRSIAGDRAAEPIAAPFHLGDPALLRSIFREADVPSVAVATIQETGRFPSVQAMVEADLRGWLPVAGIVLSEEEIDAIVTDCRRQLASFVASDGAVAFPMSAHVAHGPVD